MRSASTQNENTSVSIIIMLPFNIITWSIRGCLFPHYILLSLIIILFYLCFVYFHRNLSFFCKIMERKKASSMEMDCSSKILKTTEDYVSKKLQYAYREGTSNLFGIRIPSHIIRTAIFLSVVIFTFTTRFYLIHEPKHIWYVWVLVFAGFFHDMYCLKLELKRVFII
jgi:hypothetical protein